MALVKLKPTSPGRRGMVKVVNPYLHKGRPFPGLVEKKSKSAGRNNNGHITNPSYRWRSQASLPYRGFSS